MVLRQLLRHTDDVLVSLPALLAWAERDDRTAQWLVCRLAELPPGTPREAFARRLEHWGIAQTEHRLLLHAVHDYFADSLPAYGISREQLIRRTLLTALWAEELTVRTGRRGLKGLLAALFAAVGMTVVDQRIAQWGGISSPGVEIEWGDLEARWAWERRHAGETSFEAGAALAVRWGFSRCLSETLLAALSLETGDRWRPLGQIVRLAHLCSETTVDLRPVDLSRQLMGRFEVMEMGASLGLQAEDWNALARRVIRAWRSVATVRLVDMASPDDLEAQTAV